VDKAVRCVVKQLLRAGADVNCTCTEQGLTPLMLTASSDIASCLLDNGADISRECSEGFTALGAASAKGNLAVVHVLLKRGAESHILKHSKNAHTPLSAAVSSQHEEIAVLLLRHLVVQPDFDINHPRLGLNQPLLCSAVAYKMPRVVELAIRHGAAVDIIGPNESPMRMAAETRQYAIVDLLCDGGADVNTRYAAENGLDTAARALDVKMIKLMLKHGADVNAVASDQRYSALHVVAMAGTAVDFTRTVDVVKLLLAAGAEVDLQRQREMLCTVCSMAPDAEAAQILKLLLPHCSSAMLDDAEPTTGHTALSTAVVEAKLQAARVLHAAGANIHHSTDLCTMMHRAAASGSIAVAKWVQSLGVDPRATSGAGPLPLFAACRVNDVEMVSYLLSLPADDVHAKVPALQQTALHSAAGVESDGLLQLLLSRGAVVDVVDCSGATPLMYAKTASAVKLLLAAGADPLLVDARRSNLLHYQASCGASTGAVCLAIKAGVDPTATDANECPPAHYAGISGHFALEILLSRAADDHRKKRAAAAAAAETGSSTAAAEASSSGSAASAAASEAAATASIESSSTVADGQLSGVAAALSSMAVTADSTDSSSSSSSSVQAADVQQQQQQQPKARKAKQPCTNCSTPTTKLCRRCAAVYYCSVDCQKVCFADAQHRAQCEATAVQNT
jgi:uncharacterized protein